MADRLVDDLEALAAELDWPDVPDLSAAVRARIVATEPAATTRPMRRWLPVAIAAALIAAAALVIPAPREAIARWFGIAGVQIHGGTDLPPPVTNGLRLGQSLPVAEAVDRTPFTVTVPPDLPAPNAAFVGEPSSDAVTLTWAPSKTLPPAGPAGGLGLLLTQFRGDVRRPLLDKQIGPNATVEETSVSSEPAFWITGAPHFLLYLDPTGQTREDTVRLAGNTLLWSHQGVTFRLESALDRDDAIALAESLAPID